MIGNKECLDRPANMLERQSREKVEQPMLTRSYANAHTHQSLNVSHIQNKEVKEGTRSHTILSLSSR